MTESKKIHRRHFIYNIGLGLLAGAGATGCKKGGDASKKPSLDSRFTYDVSAFEHTDPALLRYQETTSLPTGLDQPKCLAMGPQDIILVGGDQAVKFLGKDGKVQSTIVLAEKPNAIWAAEEGRILVAMKNHFEIFDRSGALIKKSEALNARSHLTGITCSPDMIYVADAGNREIVCFDHEGGKVLSRFGRIGSDDGNPGFIIPSPYFRVMFCADGLLWVNNPGRYHIEAYSPDGKFELSWGEPSMGVEGFCGCCNPIYFSRLPNGNFVTSEKGLNRIKLYTPKGIFKGVVAGPEHLVKDFTLAKKACTDCQVGFGFDVACDSSSNVLALDVCTRQIRVFTPKPNAS